MVSADPAVPQSPATASALDANGAKLASPVPDTAADSVRLVANELEGKTPELLRDAPAQRSSEQTTGRAISVREALQPPPTELARQRLSAMTAADSASVPATTPIAKEFHRLDGAPRVSEVGTTTPGVAAIVTEASAAQSVDAPKLAAELPAGNEARLPGALADRLQWMIDQNLGEARIKLNPPQLGAIDIKITMADDQAFVQFTASQPGARDVIESALPRLRDLLGAAGLELGGATVGGQTTSREQAEVRWSALPELEPLDVGEALTGVSQPARGRIDIYA